MRRVAIGVTLFSMAMHPKTVSRYGMACLGARWSRRGLRISLVVTALAMLLLQAIAPICALGNAGPGAPSVVAADTSLAGVAHLPDGADPCCASLTAAGDAALIALASAGPTGSTWLALAATFVVLAGVVLPTHPTRRVAPSPPGTRRYPARSSRILR